MREHDIHVDTTLLFVANDNGKIWRVLINRELYHVHSELEAQAMISEAKQIGADWIMTRPDGTEEHGGN